LIGEMQIAGNMKIRLLILVLVFAVCRPAFGAGASRTDLVRDGYGLMGVEGKLSKVKAGDEDQYVKFDDDDEVWLFTLGADLNDYRGTVKSGTSLQLLPSAGLEKLVADAEEHPGSTYRLWGRITTYKGANYVYCAIFLPIVKVIPAEIKIPEPPVEPNVPEPVEARKEPTEPNSPKEPKAPDPPKEPTEPNEPKVGQEKQPPPTLKDPNGILDIPKDILEKFRTREIVLPRKIKPRPKPPEKTKEVPPEKPEKKSQENGEQTKTTAKTAPETAKEKDQKDSPAVKENNAEAEKKPEPVKRPAIKLDSMLADRMATLIKKDGGRAEFVLDALGLSVQKLSLRLLPCEVLELTETRQVAELNPVRFKIAGIKTEYKGKHYILLQKAMRVYGHGNFGN